MDKVSWQTQEKCKAASILLEGYLEGAIADYEEGNTEDNPLIDSCIEIKPKILEVGRKFGKVDVEVYHEGQVVGKAMMMVQIIH